MKPLNFDPNSKEDITVLADYLQKVGDEIPSGLSQLKDTVSFVCLDLRLFVKKGIKTASYVKALAFARSVPHVENVGGDELTSWMVHDEEHLKYFI